MNVLQIESLRKDFKGVRALRGIDIHLDGPGVYGFLGPNGAGKSTTFKVICGLLRPSAGRVLVEGIDVQKDPRRVMARLGIQFDAPAFYPHLSGRDNLRVIARWLDGDSDGRPIDALLDQVGLSGAAQRKVGGYSWGMKQRLGLAAALLPDPRLILLDEPSNGLDPKGIAEIRRLLPRLAREEGRTVFVSSHRMDEVEQTCDHVTIIHQGVIVAAGRLDELAADSEHIELLCSDPDAATRILTDLPEVARVEPTAGGRLLVHALGLKPGIVNQILVQQGITVEQFSQKREPLEQLFFRLIESAEAGSQSDV